ncbi:MAG: hypothetical protein IKQ04_05270 [Oscillospiraceae bacterium]|nr:hypothetical protein [Oscillospiraceae bacterium]
MPRMLVWQQEGDTLKQAFDVFGARAKDFSVSETLISFSELDVSRLHPIAEGLYQKADEYFSLKDKRKFTAEQFLEFQAQLHEAVAAIYELGELYGNLAEAEFCECGPYYWSLDQLLLEQRLDFFGTCAAIQNMFSIGCLLVYFFIYVNAWICEGLEEYIEKGTLLPAHAVCEAQITLFFDKGVVTERYEFQRSRDYFSYLLLRFAQSGMPLRKCAYCGKLFVPLSKKHTKYCERIQKNGKTCMELGPANRHRKAVAKDPVLETYDRVKRRMYKRTERTSEGYGVSAFPMSIREYSAWLEAATAVRQQYLDREISAEEAIKKLEPDETKRPTPVEYDIGELDQPRENPVSDKTAWWQEGTAELLRALKKGQESGELIPEEDVVEHFDCNQ